MIFKSLSKLEKLIKNSSNDDLVIREFLNTPNNARKWNKAYGEQHGHSLLRAVIEKDAVKLLAAMIEQGVPLNEDEYEREWPPLRNALYYGKVDCVEYLVNKGAEITPRYVIDEIEKGSAYNLTCLLESVPDRYHPRYFLKALSSSGNLKSLQVILKGLDDVNTISIEGKTLLAAAILKNNAPAASLLLSKGAEARHDDVFGALVKTYRDNDAHNAILESAKSETFDFGNGKTYLHLAAQAGNYSLAGKLMSMKTGDKALFDLNARDDDGNTPLHYAIQSHDVSTVNLLLQAGALTDIKNRFDADAVTYANSKAASTNVKRAVNSFLKKQGKVNAVATIKDNWKDMKGDQIAHIETHTEIGKKITRIFNFRDHERMIIVENIKNSGQNAVTCTGFNDIADSTLQEAFNAYKQKGGKLDEQQALYGETKPADFLTGLGK